MDLERYTENDFRRNPPSNISGSGRGLAEILISGSLVDPYTSGSVPESGSWPYLQSSSSSMVWNSASYGDISSGSVIGVKLYDLDITDTDNKHSFQLCNSIALTISAGSTNQTLVLDVLDREINNGYAYFKVNAPLNAINGVKFMFSKDGDIFIDYECSVESNGSPITFVVEPYFSIEENSVFNPVINNVTRSVPSTNIRKVETIKSGSSIEYALGLPAEIPDSYQTSIACIGGRSLGAKAGYEAKAVYINNSLRRDYNTLKGFVSRYVRNSTVDGERTLVKETLDLIDSHTSSVVPFDSASIEYYDYQELRTLSGSGLLNNHIAGKLMSGSVFTGSYNGVEITGSLVGSVSGYLSGSLTGSFTGWIRGSVDGSWGTGSATAERSIMYLTSELGVDPAFFTVQEFSGSVYSIDADNIPDITDMQFSSVKFMSRTIFEIFDLVSGEGSFERKYRRSYNKNNNSVDLHTATLPIVGDVVYSEDLSKRLSNSKIFIQETGQVFLTDEFASVVSMSAVSSSS